MGHWYIVQTNPQNERKATGELRRAGIRVYLPQSASETIHKRTKERVVRRRVLMAGYVFVRFPDRQLDARGVPPFILARSCQGVKGLLTAADDRGEWVPFPVPDSIIAGFMRRQRRGEFGKPTVENNAARMERMRSKYKRGAHAVVADGPFTSFHAEIMKLLDNGTVEAEISIMGRKTKVRFDKPENELRIAA